MKKNLFFILIIFGLTGCDVYDSGFDTSSVDADECLQSGGRCDELTVGSGIALSIEGPNPIRPQSVAPTCDHDNSKYCFDVSGKCNTDGHPISRIEMRGLVDTVSQAPRGYTVRNAPITCERGRFWIQLALDTTPCTIQRATIELIAEDTTGAIFTNPARAIQTIDMLVQQDATCP